MDPFRALRQRISSGRDCWWRDEAAESSNSYEREEIVLYWTARLYACSLRADSHTDLLSPSAAGRLVGVTHAAIYHAMNSGRLTIVHTNGKRRVVRGEVLARMARRN